MPRKPSKYVERAELDRLEGQLTLTRIGLQCGLHERPEADCLIPERYADGKRTGCFYRFRVYRSQGPTGGILLLTFKAPGQADSTTAYYWDQWQHQPHPWPAHVLEGVSECKRQLYERERPARAEQPELIGG